MASSAPPLSSPSPSPLRYPAPLRAGCRVVVTAPSSGVQAPLHARLDLALAHLRAQGLVVEEGRCLRQQVHSASAPADERAAELMHTLLRDDVQALVPPWGGERAIELLDRLDWPALAQARPKWVLGYSDTSTWMLPLTLRLGWATAHGPCLMDLVPAQRDPLSACALAVLGTPAGGTVLQRSSSRWQRRWTDFAADPGGAYALSDTTCWRTLHGAPEAQVEGRLIGGCLDTLMHTAATAHGDVAAFIRAQRDERGEGTLLYLENAALGPCDWLRALQRLRWSGWLDGLAGLLVGRCAAPDSTGATDLRHQDALRQTLGDLPCPVLLDLDIGHLPPQLVLVNGAWARVQLQADGSGSVLQRFV